ncbi:MAG: NFYB/HAP3 family transcription factor subunit [archaeon]|nr:NFYB/HAP3 family transcription factor subunit [archaeon]
MAELPKAPIARITKDAGADRISEDAKDALVAYLEEQAREITIQANKVAGIAKRRTIKADDIKLVIKNL